jgi:hypothetical protein
MAEGAVMRKAVLSLVGCHEELAVFDLAPFLAGYTEPIALLEIVPPHRRIALCGCSGCCSRIVLERWKIEVGHVLIVNGSLPADEAIRDVVTRVELLLSG